MTKSGGGVGGLGDRAVEDNGDTCQDHRRDVADMLLQRGLMVCASKPLADGFQVWASKTRLELRQEWEAARGVIAMLASSRDEAMS